MELIANIVGIGTLWIHYGLQEIMLVTQMRTAIGIGAHHPVAFRLKVSENIPNLPLS